MGVAFTYNRSNDIQVTSLFYNFEGIIDPSQHTRLIKKRDDLVLKMIKMMFWTKKVVATFFNARNIIFFDNLNVDKTINSKYYCK